MGQEMSEVAKLYLEDSFKAFRGYRHMAEGAIAQVKDDELFKLIDPEANSIAIVMQHIAGNMRSRWTDFLTSDGEKPDRHRDTEFEMYEADTREALMKRWEEGWALVFAAIEGLSSEDVGRTVNIRGTPHTVLQAINRQLLHYAYHVGQIVFLCKHFCGPNWKSLSIPRGKSEDMDGNRRLEQEHLKS